MHSPFRQLVQRRSYAISRFPTRQAGPSRSRNKPPLNHLRKPPPDSGPHEDFPSTDKSQLWHTTSQRPPTDNPGDGLRKLLLGNNTLIVERQIEMLNIFVGFEQSNKYSISNEHGVPLGYIAEEPKGFLGTVARQAFATHRPFRAVIMDLEGSPVLWVRRPFAWINSRMYVQRLKEHSDYSPEDEPILDTFGEIQQIWHPWRRKYDIYLRERGRRILSTTSEPQPEPEISRFSQFAQVDMPFLSWHFRLHDEKGEEIAFISRAFRGFGREIFTDTGQYSITFGPGPKEVQNGNEAPGSTHLIRDLALDERAFRASPLTSAASILILVATDVDALCAARMISNLFNQDDVIHRIIPVPGFPEFETARADILSNDELHTLILLNLGGMADLASDKWFGNDNPRLSIHVIDSMRPIHLGNYFMADYVTVWDDGEADKEHLQSLGKSFEVVTFEPDYVSDDEDDDDTDPVSATEDEAEDDNDNEYGDRDVASGKRRSIGHGDSKPVKRRRTSRDRPKRMTRDEYERHQDRVAKYYMQGSFHGQSAAGTVYILATVLERVDNDLLWYAILGLTYQYTTSRISRDSYTTFQAIYNDEVSRLNPTPTASALTSLKPNDTSIRASDELRFMLFRHWTLYDAMYHSSYVASKLGIWQERGRKRLTGLLAKMGFSIPQTQQPYAHMDMDLKNDLLQRLSDVAPEYGLVELSYPSFIRSYGYRSQPLSAADAVEGISSLMDVASGVKIEVEIEGARNGGEWFGGGRVWEAKSGREVAKNKTEGEKAKQQPPGPTANALAPEDDAEESRPRENHWWIKNFWIAYDALDDIGPLREALNLAMSLHRAIIRQGTSIIDKQDIKTMRNYRVVILSQGPDLPLFAHPSVLARLALWLVDALRDRLPSGGTAGTRTQRKGLPFVVACLNETTDTYMVVGVMASWNFGDVRRNDFGAAFIGATQRCNTQTQHTSFDASVLEIPQKDLKIFLDALCDGPDDL
ncbi:hypothetical protein DXG03_005071 [Asterophora parasitica]|uniref:Cell division control protein 45 n=1 Tax=Asterophora parasitica TaxID=117018 RepID=A0A9P7G8M9_9AGAR|nr:hypothetical protein DXG03_005071 [Asterophora parasitica]